MRKLFLLLMGFMFIAGQAMAQRTVSGKVTDANGSPLSNVSILVKGTTIGTTSNADGSYSIQLPSNAKTLVFTGVDMQEVEKAIGTQTTFNTTMTSIDKSMEEIVVVAYGTVKKENFTGSASTIDGKDIERRPITNVATAIVGSSPGVQTNAGSGQPGSAPSVRIRGIGSVSGSSVSRMKRINSFQCFTRDEGRPLIHDLRE